jgi:hypothetical protein
MIEQRAFHSYRVGDVAVSVVSDGSIVVPVTESLVSNAPIDEVRKALCEAELPADMITTTFAPVILQIGRKTVLIDTGFGPDVGDELQSTKGLLVNI